MTAPLMELDILLRDLAAPAPGTPEDVRSPARRTGRHDWDAWLTGPDAPGTDLAGGTGTDPAPPRRRTGRDRGGRHRRGHRLADLVDVIRAVRIVPWT